MPYGYHGKILHVDLTAGKVEVEEPDESFYRKYMGGSAMGATYLLKHTPPGADPLGPENTLSLMVGVVTGAPFSGQSRVCATAKSPVTGLVGDSQAGGFWPAELKFAGFDGIVIHGQAEQPVYLWVHDGGSVGDLRPTAELRDAAHLWGQFTADVEDAIREELGDRHIQVLQCGPAAEKGVRFGALINNANRANGRTGMGTVMASKNLKAVAVRGRNRPELADPDAVKALAKWGVDHFEESDIYGMGLFGTAEVVMPQDKSGGLPTRNWASGTFEEAEAISGKRMAETVLKDRDTCFGCVVRCKRVVEITEGPYRVDPRYGGPEYETLSTMGSYCGVSDLAAISRANQLCNMYGMDTISCGATIAWAMDCFERGLLTLEDTDGIELRFGNAEALVQMAERIGKREDLGRLLGEGSARAAETLGVGQDLVVAVKNHELPAHMPQVKRSLALIYAVNPFGADHQSHEHDPSYKEYPDRMAELDLLDPQPSKVLNAAKVRYALYTQYMYSLLDSVSVCQFVWGPAWHLCGPSQLVEAVRAVTGWNVSLWELMKVGERRLNLLRAFNAREGGGAEADTVPAKLLIPLQGGKSDGVAVTVEEVEEAKASYYRMAGWDENGCPTRGKLEELALGWVADELKL
ncbi:MAG: aldehyde ferredoxin oxidoreductase family protein [Anaerolineae bacterium]|nr:aldehyde ferredoxin oxidoreductase family protein [Anaerolineae bacterium]